MHDCFYVHLQRLFEDHEMDKCGAGRGPAVSTASCVSAKTDRSRRHPPEFSIESRPSEGSDQTSSNIHQNPDTLKVLKQEDEQEDVHETRNEANEAALKIALHVLRTMNEEEHAQTLEQSHSGELVVYQRTLKSFLKKKNKYLFQEKIGHNTEHLVLKPGLKRCACELTVNLNTVHKLLEILDGRKVTQGRQTAIPDHLTGLTTGPRSLFLGAWTAILLGECEDPDVPRTSDPEYKEFVNNLKTDAKKMFNYTVEDTLPTLWSTLIKCNQTEVGT
ncbi:protein NLRC3-like isoform X2 [Lates japonicus]|uniref:Protein NLRC3-like isoform X2 n=1 Tax=Lates japonicus TaxID=270547 RepID=A0AAD3NKZ8_LATJO|nr:protein NLRC3-like isoform X2 [Lates japonicus]